MACAISFRRKGRELKNGWERKARQLLLDPRGRAALKTFGLDVEIAGKEETKDKPIVVILSPTYRNVSAQVRDSLMKMVEYTREKDFAVVYTGTPVSASIIHWARNWLMGEQLKSGKPWTHALLIDDDMVVEPDALERLLSHKKDVVAGLCTRRNDPPIPNMRHFDDKEGATNTIWEWPEGKLVEVHAVGTGLMLVTKNAFEQVAQAYFDCLWEKDFYGLSEERIEQLRTVRIAAFDKDKTCYWFRCLPTPKGDIEMGEDVTFCHLLRKYCGIPIYVDTAVQPGHLGTYPYAIRDFLPYRDDMILRAKIKGEYKMEVPEMKISILCPTRGRPQNVSRLVDSIEKTSTIMPEIVFYVDEDDDSFPQVFTSPEIKVVRGPRIIMSEMWNKCVEASTGEILMMGGDDLIFRTKGWDDQVRRAFASFPDRLVFVHGEDCYWHEKFGTHGFLHRNWVKEVGYLCPPHYASDYNDSHVNEVANYINRRVFLPFVTEHMHPVWGKGEWDKTHKERLERQAAQKSEELFLSKAWERKRDADILRRAIQNYEQGVPAGQSFVATV